MSRKLHIEYPGAVVGMQKEEWTGGPAKAHNELQMNRDALADGQLEVRF